MSLWKLNTFLGTSFQKVNLISIMLKWFIFLYARCTPDWGWEVKRFGAITVKKSWKMVLKGYTFLDFITKCRFLLTNSWLWYKILNTFTLVFITHKNYDRKVISQKILTFSFLILRWNLTNQTNRAKFKYQTGKKKSKKYLQKSALSMKTSYCNKPRLNFPLWNL